MDFETYALLKNHIDKLSFNEKAEVPSTQQDKGKVVTVNSEGDKILEYPSAISYKYAYKMQETESAVLFCVNVGETEPCTYFIPGETKITTLRIYKNGEAVEGSQLATQTPYDKFRVVECNETRVYLILSNSNSYTASYFYYFSKGKWEIKVEQYPLTELENMFIGFDNEKEFTPESDFQPATKKYVDDECRKLSEEIANKTGSGTGLTDEAKTALLNCFKNVAWTVSNGQEYYNTLENALNGSSNSGNEETETTLSSISATYTGGEVTVGTSLTALTGITVTGTYIDGSTKTITGYTLSGTIAEGSNTITVSYSGKITTFTVTGVAESSGDDSGTEDELNLLPSGTYAEVGEMASYCGYTAEYNRTNEQFTLTPKTDVAKTSFYTFITDYLESGKDYTVFVDNENSANLSSIGFYAHDTNAARIGSLIKQLNLISTNYMNFNTGTYASVSLSFNTKTQMETVVNGLVIVEGTYTERP